MALTTEQKAWLTALESGDYEQGNSVLRNRGDQFCCLGVACDLFKAEVGMDWLKDGAQNYVFAASPDSCGHTAGVPVAVQTLLRLRGTLGERLTGRSLAVMNDTGLSFAQLVAFIRANPDDVFIPLKGECGA